jgi:hypothetical protein
MISRGKQKKSGEKPAPVALQDQGLNLGFDGENPGINHNSFGTAKRISYRPLTETLQAHK